jgi:NADP-dependent 3-hydroxy acid dehydrogenase YdfG
MTSRHGQVVVITGGSSGIGLATALRLSAEGASVVLASRGEQALARAAQRCEAAGGTVLTVPTDIADAHAVDALLDRAVQRFGHVDAGCRARACWPTAGSRTCRPRCSAG